MASYNGDFNRMQEEALNRLREMQKRSRTAVNQPRPQPPPPPPPEHDPPNHNRDHGHTQSHPQSSPSQVKTPAQDVLKSILGDVKIDSEKALILLMLFVLYKNKADMKLLLALGYLLM